MKPLDNKYKCLPFWSWNGELDKNRLLDQISWMHENGVGGFFIHARSGLTTPYLKEEWFDCVNASILKAKELNMEPYAYDENGWPSGFAGRKLLEDIENHDMYITHKEGEYDPESAASFDISGDNIKKVTSGHNVMNIYLHYSVATVDILNPKVVDQFIEATHEKYYENDKKTKYLRGLFTDAHFMNYFKINYNESGLDRIALLFVEKEGYRDYRYKYYKALQDLMLNNWAKKLYAWCDSHNYKLTGHYVEESIVGYQVMCCGGVMPFYEYEHIPGVDYLGRSTNYYADLIGKQVGSVAAQLKKEQVITETYGCCGWDVTPQELKIIAERQYVEGVNLMCQHLLPYEEHGQRKRDYPAHFSTFNPWIKENFKEFNDYFSYLGRF